MRIFDDNRDDGDGLVTSFISGGVDDLIIASDCGVDLIIDSKGAVWLIVMTGSGGNWETVADGENNGGSVDGDGRSFVVDVGDIDGNVRFGRESGNTIVSDFNTKNDGLVFFIV